MPPEHPSPLCICDMTPDPHAHENPCCCGTFAVMPNLDGDVQICRNQIQPPTESMHASFRWGWFGSPGNITLKSNCGTVCFGELSDGSFKQVDAPNGEWLELVYELGDDVVVRDYQGNEWRFYGVDQTSYPIGRFKSFKRAST